MKLLRQSVAFVFFLALVACGPSDRPVQIADRYTALDIAGLQEAMDSGDLSSVELVEYYCMRIEALDRSGPTLRAIIETNPDALAIAAALDTERAESGPRGPLHGIPVVIKANIGTADLMATTAGSAALASHYPNEDAFLVEQLRDAGAIILAKANLSEWANFRSTRSSSGWSSIGGQTRNPYDPTRSPCGSSSGSAVAVASDLAPLAVGTETDGSIICPSGINGIVGIKPSLGLVSRSGIIPLAHSQDTAGPMARTVRDAAILLHAMTAIDHFDSAMSNRPDIDLGFADDLSGNAIAGKRIGVIRNYSGAGTNPYVEEIFEGVIELLRSEGAEIVDPIEIDTRGMGEAEEVVLFYEFKSGLNLYLSESDAPMQSLEEIIAFNNDNAHEVMPFFGQDIFELAQRMGPLSDQTYLAALTESKQIAQSGIDNALHMHDLDALIAPTNGPAWIIDYVNGDRGGVGSSGFAAVSGYASVTVPAGYVFDLPVGVSFIGGQFSEKTLIQIAYAYERANPVRQPPDFE